MTDLGTVNGDPNSIAYGINSEGQVVGGSQDSSFNSLHAFLWEKGSMSDLNALIPANLAVQLTVALGINEQGQIAAAGLASQWRYTRFRADPVRRRSSERRGLRLLAG